MYYLGQNSTGTLKLTSKELVSNLGFPGGSLAKNSPVSAGDMGSVPESGRFPGEGNGSHSSILAWESPWTEEPGRATLQGVTKESDVS